VRIAERDLETIVGLEAKEQIRHLDIFVHSPAYAAGIVKDQSSRHTADPVKNIAQAVHHALGRLAAEQLRVARVAVGEGDAEELTGFLLAVRIKDIRFTEIDLRFTRRPFQFQQQ
ncbi:hypothetical protein, partial [Cohnella thermotolerans]|uniref:hypothetical protein n=1 Tax=Cohnella thermotolerans TaxID=329858 RepID=UPI00146FB855